MTKQEYIREINNLMELCNKESVFLLIKNLLEKQV